MGTFNLTEVNESGFLAPRKRLWLLAGMVVITGGWMAFDGAHALITGDFVTPSSGPYEGQLGPWAAIPRTFGLEPRSPGVKAFFLMFGLTYLGALCAFLLRRRGSWFLLTALSVIALLYLPIGTLTSVLSLALLATLRPRRAASEDSEHLH